MLSAAELSVRAQRLLAAREHSRAELRGKLAREADEAVLEAVLDRLVELGLQSDARFAEAYVRAKGDRLGVVRLRYELGQRGLAKDLIDAALGQLAEEGGIGDELARAKNVWKKKYGKLPQDAKEWARQARFLQSRGFSGELVRQVLKESVDESA